MFESLFEGAGGSRGGLSLQRLRTLCIVAEAGSMTAAAGGDTSKLAQYSKQITELQEYFGIALKEENVKPVQLTERGAKLARNCRDLLQELDDFKALENEGRVTIRIGAGESLLQWLLPPVVDAVAKAFPEVCVQLLNLRTSDINEKLLVGDIDLGVLNEGAADKSLKTKRITKVDGRSLLFVPKSLRKRIGRSPSFKDLAGLPLAVLEGRGSFQRLLQLEAQKAGIELDARVHTSSMPQIAAYINSGLYGGFLPKYAACYLKDAEGIPVKELGGNAPSLGFAASPRHMETRSIVRQVFQML